MKPVQRKFGQRVRELRLERGWSQEELANRAGKHWTYIGGIERGERNIPIHNMQILAEALEVRLSVLLRGI